MNHDVIILGTGGVGSAAMYNLAKRGVKVLGIDRFPPAHDRGSSHGETRVIRRSYFEHPNYVPLLNRAYELWSELEEAAEKELLLKTGLVYFGKPDGPVLQGIRTSSDEHLLNVETVSARDALTRFPQFSAPDNAACLFEPDGGCLLVEDCVASHIEQAVQLGATHQHSEEIINWSATDTHCTVTTNKNTYHAAKLVIAGGAWSASLLADLDLPLKVVRKHLHWFKTGSAEYERDSGCPCYFFETEVGYFYGCPGISDFGLKVAEHTGGESIEDPLNVDRSEDPKDSRRVEDFAARHLPKLSRRRLHHKTCFYTMTPDEHFMVDTHPEFPSVSFATGLSGHGFKFTSVLGEVLAQLMVGEEPTVDPEFLGLARVAIEK